MLLCDFAEAVNGKLYISGGGWTIVRGPNPLDCSVAVSIAVPWTQTNQKHKLILELLGEDGQIPTGPDGKPIQVEGEFEVGRPTGVVPGDPISNSLSFRLQGLDLETGSYSFSLKINGTEVAKTRFRVQRSAEAK
jgi:hypothetical protein